MSRAASSYNGGETWKPYWLFSWCCFCSAVEAGDILAGEHNARRCFANGPNRNLTAESDMDTQFIPESRLLQTDRWRVESSQQTIQELSVGADPLPVLGHVKESLG